VREIRTLERYGVFFEDLVSGRRPCTTAAQQRFVEVAQGQCAPKTDYEFLWHKYLVAVKLATRRPPPSAGPASGSPEPPPASRGPARSSLAPARSSPAKSQKRPRYRTIDDPPPNFEPLRQLPNDREDWKSMRRRQFGDTVRRSRGDD